MRHELNMIQESAEQTQSVFRDNIVPYLKAMRQASDMLVIEAVPEDIEEFKGKKVTISVIDGFGNFDGRSGKCDMTIKDKTTEDEAVAYMITSNLDGEGDITTIQGEPLETDEKAKIWSFIYKVFDRVETLPARKRLFRDLGRTSLVQFSPN